MSEIRPVPVVVGTSGHIDHGKSALIEALTGNHPDRWEEEQRRGITIDLGYAQMSWPDGLEVGFVDVPGHERLVRKMVAGAAGMGAALLVVACDDGVMPQTREHFEILRLLGIDRGLVVLSKVDLADEDTRLLVQEDVASLVVGTPWENAPVLEFSAHSGEGLEDLRVALRTLVESIPVPGDGPEAFRLPVQRSFALHGAGTVATGVCSAGILAAGADVEIQPGGGHSRVRRVQVHGHAAEEARPGLRTALNLPGLEVADCPRGAVLATPGSLQADTILRVTLEPLPGAPPLEHGQEVQVLLGTAAEQAVLGLPQDAETPQIAELRLTTPLAAAPGDLLILRRPSPACNLASGRMLAFGKHRLRKRDQKERDRLRQLAAALQDPAGLPSAVLEVLGGRASALDVAAFLGWRLDATTSALQIAAEQGSVRESGNAWTSVGNLGELGQAVAEAVAGWRKRNPHRLRLPVSALRDRLGKKKAQQLAELDDADLSAAGLRRRGGTEWEIAEAEAPEADLDLAEKILQAVAAGKLSPPTLEAAAEAHGADTEATRRAAELLADQDEVVRIPGGMTFARSVVEELRSAVVAQLEGEGMNIPALRDQFETTRKFLMPLLEYLDSIGVTERRGGNRVLRRADAPLA